MSGGTVEEIWREVRAEPAGALLTLANALGLALVVWLLLIA